MRNPTNWNGEKILLIQESKKERLEKTNLKDGF